MKILATVLLGPGSEASVPEAIASVRDRVDGFVLIESGGGEAAMAAAQAVATSFRAWSYTWQQDYGKARQFALDVARAEGADYALTLDPDERLELPEAYRERLESFPQIDIWKMKDRDDGYQKERIIRCASPARWHGTVCENVEGIESRALLEGQFWELKKTPEQHRARHERGVIETQKMIEAGDDRYKWHRHRGTCLMAIGRQAEAFEEYQIALRMAESPEDRAWCSYLIAEQLVLRGELEEARKTAALALAEHAGFLPEFAWILAYVDYKRGEDEQGQTTRSVLHWQNASRWAQIALNMPADKTRVSFRSKNYVRGCHSILATIHGRAAENRAVESAA